MNIIRCINIITATSVFVPFPVLSLNLRLLLLAIVNTSHQPLSRLVHTAHITFIKVGKTRPFY